MIKKIELPFSFLIIPNKQWGIDNKLSFISEPQKLQAVIEQFNKIQ
ncbi:MAG: hypothetical protein N4A49_02455 [Marinifilaceae bacterium]|jgi:hypothetical protein|nr:hypothetical protein [Marinifilaceae bacterium]